MSTQTPLGSPIQRWLNRAPDWLFVVYAGLVAFATYFCMYAFRKPVSAATFAGEEWGGLDYKILLMIAQILGYTLSKFLGIKVVSEMTPGKRAVVLFGLVGAAFLALVGFAAVPRPWNIPFLFLNGLPLGMVWGLVFSYLEGRRYTEVLGAILSASFIIASGVVKSVGRWMLVDLGVSEYWMPAAVGAVFLLPLGLFVWLLNQTPPPSQKDIELRTERKPMSGHERRAFFSAFWPGLVLLIIVYILLTVYRDFRDTFMAELWVGLGYGDTPEIFAQTETPIGLAVMVLMALTIIIKNNRIALQVYHIIILLGILLVGASTWLYVSDRMDGAVWLTLVGLGLYMGYVPYNSILFDRLIAAFKRQGNAGYLIYVADSFGYLGSVGIMLYRNLGQGELSWIRFFINISWVLFALGLVGIVGSMAYFWLKKAPKTQAPADVPLPE